MKSLAMSMTKYGGVVREQNDPINEKRKDSTSVSSSNSLDINKQRGRLESQTQISLNYITLRIE
jgi:hypothetical protein